jgi:hypothetical protein
MTSKPTQWWKVGLGTTAVVAGFVVAHLIDKPVYDLLRSWGRIEEEDWLRMFRVFGFAPTWLLGGGGVGAARQCTGEGTGVDVGDAPRDSGGRLDGDHVGTERAAEDRRAA